MVIGIGTGNTPFAAGANPETQFIEAVEIIAPDVDLLAQYARQTDHVGLYQIFNDPRYSITIGDGRREIAQSDEQYDIIVIDAMVPHWSHAGTLYSQEFYLTVKSRLKEDGLFVQWRPNDRVEDTVTSVFEHVLVMPAYLVFNLEGEGEETTFLIASSSPIPFERSRVLERLGSPEVIQYLERGGIDPAVFRSWLEASPLAEWGPDMPRRDATINTDLFPNTFAKKQKREPKGCRVVLSDTPTHLRVPSWRIL
jgi:spermidine synthase